MKKFRVTCFYTANVETEVEVEAETEEEALDLAQQDPDSDPERGEITKWWFSSERVQEI